MCLGIPARITSIDDEGLLRQGVVDFGGTTREVCLAYVPDAAIGDWVLIHVGFAISRLSASEAARTLHDLETLAEAGDQMRELGGPLPEGGPPPEAAS